MIIFKGIRDANKTLAYIDFTNETGKVASIPISRDVANLISAHLRLLSPIREESAERGNDQPSD
jgi:hypothetical protein